MRLSAQEFLASNRKHCYYIPIEGYVEGKGFIPAIVFQGVSGYYSLAGDEGTEPWYWGKTFPEAEEVARRKNEELGVSATDALDIVLSSMF